VALWARCPPPCLAECNLLCTDCLALTRPTRSLPGCRFTVLQRRDPEEADRLHHVMDEHIHLRHERLQAMSQAVNKKPAEEETK
jgi:hypothetical protein